MGLWIQVSAASTTRIITLSPALAELVFDVGSGRELVGTVRFSRHPAQARLVPRVGDAFDLDLSRILLMHPTLVLAWKGGTPPATINALRSLHLRVVTLGALRLRGIARELISIGRLVGHVGHAERAAQAYRMALSEIRRIPHRQHCLRVFYEIARAPLDTIGRRQIINRAIRICGGRNIFADIDEPAFTVSLTAVLERNPQVILVGRARSIRFWDRFGELSAVRHDAIDVIPPGWLAEATPRMLRGIRMLCRDLAHARLPG